MNKKNFDLLMQSMREGAEILNGTREPSRRFVVEKKEDVQQVRQAFHPQASGAVPRSKPQSHSRWPM